MYVTIRYNTYLHTYCKQEMNGKQTRIDNFVIQIQNAIWPMATNHKKKSKNNVIAVHGISSIIIY